MIIKTNHFKEENKLKSLFVHVDYEEFKPETYRCRSFLL